MNALLHREAEPMRFIINGRSFDTSGAATVAVSRGHNPPHVSDQGEPLTGEERYEHVLYRTPKGAFFVHEHKTTKLARGKPIVSDFAQELRADEIVAWIESHRAAIIDATGLDLPEEA
jgi:hypothetical protein